MYNHNYFFSLTLVNIFLYLITLTSITALLFLITSKKMTYLNNLSTFSCNNLLRVGVLSAILNISGTPPTPLFFVKAANLIYIFNANLITVFVAAVILNTVSIVFYIQLIKYLYKRKKKMEIQVDSNFSNLPRRNILFFVVTTLLSFFMILNLSDLFFFLNTCCTG